MYVQTSWNLLVRKMTWSGSTLQCNSSRCSTCSRCYWSHEWRKREEKEPRGMNVTYWLQLLHHGASTAFTTACLHVWGLRWTFCCIYCRWIQKRFGNFHHQHSSEIHRMFLHLLSLHLSSTLKRITQVKISEERIHGPDLRPHGSIVGVVGGGEMVYGMLAWNTSDPL